MRILRSHRAHTTRSLLAWAIISSLFTLTTGCTSWSEYFHNGFKVGPNYCPPTAPVAEHWIDENDQNVGTEPPNDARWWQTFNDPVLESLIQTAYRQNLTLREACWRILEARAQRDIAVGNLFPQSQQGYGDYMRNNVSKNSPNAAPVLQYDEWTVGANLAWELDFWGRFRRAIASADARLDASIFNYDDVLVILLADVAQQYVDLRTAEQRLIYAHEEREGSAAKFESGGDEIHHRGDGKTRRDAGGVESSSDRGHDPAPGSGPPASGQPDLHSPGDAAAQPRGDARQSIDSHGVAARGRGHAGRSLAAPAGRPPRRARRRRPERADRHRRGRIVSAFFHHRQHLFRLDQLQRPLYRPVAGGKRGPLVQLEHLELRPPGQQHPRSGRPIPTTALRLSKHGPEGQLRS